MKKIESTFWGMSLSLTLICLITAGLVALVYQLTLDPINEAKRKKLEASLTNVLPDCENIIKEDRNDVELYKAYDNDNKLVGMAVEVSEIGFGGNIRMLVGFDSEGKVVDYSILEHSETPGLGSKMTEWFSTRIPGIQMGEKELKVSKDGGEIDAITAATISSRAFLKGINSAYAIFEANHDIKK